MKKIFLVVSILISCLIVIFGIIYFSFPIKHKDIINKYADVFGLDSVLIYSVINIESGFDGDSVSKANAKGLMQLLDSTANEIAKKLDMGENFDIFDEDTNIKLGAFYLSYLLQMYDGNVINALCAYNWGLNNVNSWLEKGNIDKEGTITNIPIKETRNYIRKYKINNFFYSKIL